MALTQPPPLTDPVLEPGTREQASSGLMNWVWIQWLLTLVSQATAAPQTLRRVSVAAQQAAIAATPVPMAALTAGLYRVSWYARITQAATTSSSLIVTIGFTDGGIPCTSSGAALTGNTTATVQSGSVVIRVDGATPITFAAAYASVGGTPMQFGLEVLIEAIGA